MPRVPVKGSQNPITLILEESVELVLAADAEVAEEFGLPLFTVAPGKGGDVLEWPADPEALSPEEMRLLVNLHGRKQVGQWLMEEAMRRMAESTMSPDGSDGRAGP